MVHNLSQKYPGRIGRTITATAISKQNFDSLAEICEVVTNTSAAPSFGFVRTSGDVFDLKDDYYKNEAMEPEAKKSDGSVKFSDKDYMQLEDMDKALNIINNKVPMLLLHHHHSIKQKKNKKINRNSRLMMVLALP